MGGDAAFELGEPRAVAAEQVEHVLGGADRALDPAQRVAAQQLLDALQGREQLLGPGREPLAQRRGLRGHVVAAPGHDQVPVLLGAGGEAYQGGDDPVSDQFERAADLHLLDVLGQVAAGHALVDVLVAGEFGELLDAGLDVVLGDALALGDRGEVDLLEHALVVGDHAVGDGHAQLVLGLEHRQPQAPLGLDLADRVPDVAHFLRGVPLGEHIRSHAPSMPTRRRDVMSHSARLLTSVYAPRKLAGCEYF